MFDQLKQCADVDFGSAGPALAGEMGLHGVVSGMLEIQCAWKGAARQQQQWDANGQAVPVPPPMPRLPPPPKAGRPPLPLDDDQLVGLRGGCRQLNVPPGPATRCGICNATVARREPPAGLS